MTEPKAWSDLANRVPDFANRIAKYYLVSNWEWEADDERFVPTAAHLACRLMLLIGIAKASTAEEYQTSSGGLFVRVDRKTGDVSMGFEDDMIVDFEVS